MHGTGLRWTAAAALAAGTTAREDVGRHRGARRGKWRSTFKGGGVAAGRRYNISGGSCDAADAGDAKRDGAASTRARQEMRGGRYFVDRPPRTVFHPPSRFGVFEAVGSGGCGQDSVEESGDSCLSPPFVTVAHWHSNGGRVRCRLREVDAAVPVCPRTQQYKIVKKIFF